LASHWIVPAASFTSASSVKVVVTNPSSADPVTVTVSSVVDGKMTPLPGMSNIQVLAGGRGGFDVPTGAKAPQVFVDVTGGSGTVVEAKIVFTTGGQTAALAVPLAGTNEVAPVVAPPAAAQSTASTLPGGTGLLPGDTTPPGTSPGGTTPPGTGG
jgi:hypothetical protein